MRIFEKPNTSNNWKCPICNTSEEKEVVLIDMPATTNGFTVEAEQVHVSCLDLVYYKSLRIIYQKI